MSAAFIEDIYSIYGVFSCFFADNTYVSSSENDEDVLVTTDPIPVIFHRIATGNSNFVFYTCYFDALYFQ